MTNAEKDTTMDLVNQLAAQLGCKVVADDSPTTVVAEKPKRKAKSKPAASQASQVAADSARTSRHGTAYGMSPVIGNGIGKQIDALATHKARLQALEDAIPGLIEQVGRTGIHSSGVDKRWTKGSNVKKHTSDFRFMNPNGCFTWILLPGGKNCGFGNYAPRDIFEKLKACGYAFSGKNLRWATDNKGNHITRRGFGGCQGIGLDTAE